MSEASELKAGRETDRLVAEKVLGLFVGKREAKTVADRFNGNDGLFVCEKAGGLTDEGDSYRYVLPRYSTDPAAAAEVLAWLRKKAEASKENRRTIMRTLDLETMGRSQWGDRLAYLVYEADLPLTWCLIALKLAEQQITTPQPCAGGRGERVESE